MLAGCAAIPPQDTTVTEQLLKTQLASLPPRTPHTANTYLIALAGFDTPAVFGNEARLARERLDRTFATGGKSILLSNADDDIATTPQATPDSLSAAITGLSRLMNHEEDLLVLYLVSHGGKDGSLQLRRGRNRPLSLAPSWLSAQLGAAGIRWRAIFVSACYSGTFQEVLRNGSSLILTAADAHHPSFGCGSTDRYTYFGEALFEQDLDMSDWPQIYGKLAEAIRQREEAIGIREHSNPQFWLGPLLARKFDPASDALDHASEAELEDSY